MKPSHEEFTRWVDGELDPARTAELAADPALVREREAARALGHAVRKARAPAMDVAGPDLFMHQLARRLDIEDQGPVAAPTPGRASQGVAWLAAAAAALVALLAVLGLADRAGEADGILLSTYAPDPEVGVIAHYDQQADAVVFVLEGLAPVEGEEEIAALLVPRSVHALRGEEEGKRHRHQGGEG